jgi:sec-independent protein translocase protein TatB
MFDAGFWEMALIFVLALLVVGPERLPGLAKKVGFMVGKARRFVTNVRSDIEQELRTEDLEKMLNQQKNEIQELKSFLHATKSETEQSFKETENLLASIDESASSDPHKKGSESK